MQLTEQQKQAILKIADFLAERNSEDVNSYNRAYYEFCFYGNESRYHSNIYNNDTIDGFRDFYERSTENANTFCRNSDEFRDILKDAENLYGDKNFNEVWEDFIKHLREYRDFDDARDYALMRSVVLNEQPDLYTLGELSNLLEKFITDYDEYEHDDIEIILKDIYDEYSWWAKSDNYRLKRLIEGYEEAFKELENMLGENEED